jgi:hypothetical protein
LKKILIITIILLYAILNNFAQELNFQLDFGEITDFSLGAGIDFSVKKTSIQATAGYGLGSMKWYGFGDDYYIAGDSSDVSNSLFFNMFYLKTMIKQVISGENKPYHMDIRFVQTTAFYLPARNPDKTIYQSDLIYGDENSNHSESGISYLFYIKDNDFWTSSGFEYYSNLKLEYGNEYDSNSWVFMSTYHKLEAWIPIAGQRLFLHLKGAGEFIPSVMKGKVPVYQYPYMSIRHVDRYFYNLSTVYSKFELISRFVRFKALWEMSFGIGAFFDLGIAGENFSDYDADNLTMSFGGFLEYKVNIDRPLPFPLTMHFGIKNQIDDDEILPGFLFEMLL